MAAFDDRRFRGNPAYEAVAVCDLPVGLRAQIESISGGCVWAVLRSRGTGEFSIGLDHETAVAFHSLSKPQNGSRLLPRLTDSQRTRVLRRLVCDQVLQIERPDGVFVDGVHACEELFGNGAHGPPEEGRLLPRLDVLSRAALDQAVGLNSTSAVALARRLYAFNTTPRTRRWEVLLGDRDAPARWLGLAASAEWRSRLARRYLEQGSLTGDTPWVQWTRRDVDPRAGARHKIYVSPASARLADALPRVATVCAALDVQSFKVGATLPGILRPDKLVVYVADEAQLRHVATELRAALDGLEAHGVPFTAPLDDCGLLFWGVDPADESPLRSLDLPWSWRTAIAERLADALARAAGQGRNDIAADFALTRLRLDGIEPIGWRPAREGDGS